MRVSGLGKNAIRGVPVMMVVLTGTPVYKGGQWDLAQECSTGLNRARPALRTKHRGCSADGAQQPLRLPGTVGLAVWHRGREGVGVGEKRPFSGSGNRSAQRGKGFEIPAREGPGCSARGPRGQGRDRGRRPGSLGASEDVGAGSPGRAGRTRRGGAGPREGPWGARGKGRDGG